MKKKILILIKSMNIGGAERSLLNMLYLIDQNRYDIDLMIYRHQGEFMHLIPNHINILPEIKEYSVFETPFKKLLLSKNFFYIFLKIFAKIDFFIKEKVFKNTFTSSWILQQYIYKYIVPLLPAINTKEYDVAVNYLGVPDILIKKVKAKGKITWIHTDYSKISANENMDIKHFSKVNYIINVSNDCNNIFLSKYPMFKSKSLVIENMLSKEFIKKQVAQFYPKEFNKNDIKLLSIGRFGKAKNFDNIPEICHLLIKNGLNNIKWYLIGYGNDEELIKNRIKEFKVENSVIILGKKTNPYPYIKHCNLYIQPSRYEGKSVTVIEAQLLNKPVVISNYATSQSQLENGVDGIILPMETKLFASELVNIILDQKLQSKLIENTKKRDYTNKNELNKIYNLFDTNFK